MNANESRMPWFFAIALALFAAPAAPLPVAVPMHVVNNHIFVDVALNGLGPFHFIVDSGAGNLVDPVVAAKIGAHVRGRVRLIGVGGAAQSGGVTTIRSVHIGNAGFINQRFIVAGTRTTFSTAEGPRIDGLIGRAIVGSGITVFDYTHHTLTFHAGDHSIVTSGSTVLPVTFSDGLPHVPCAIAGVPGSCIIDTGSRLALTVLAPFAALHPRIVPSTISATGIDGYGIGGPAYGQLGSLAKLSLGAITLKNIITDFSVQRRGAFAAQGTAANVGGGVLRRFTLTLDFPHGRIALQPNDDFYTPQRADRSGLFLVARDDAIRVRDVRPRTPAARAGILRDDVIVGVDGRRYTPDTLPDIRSVLERPADTLVRLQIARGHAATRAIILRLGDYV